jgi:hypothetical protein
LVAFDNVHFMDSFRSRAHSTVTSFCAFSAAFIIEIKSFFSIVFAPFIFEKEKSK